MIRSVIVLVCCLIGFGAAVQSRFGALLFYMWIAFFRPQDWSWVNINALRLSAVSLAMVVVPSLFTFRFPNVTHRLSIGALIFVACAVVGYQAAIELQVGWFWLTSLCTLVVVMTFLITLTDTRERFVLLVGVIAGSFAFFSSKAGLVSLISGGARFAEGLYGAFTDNNAYAIGATMITFPLVFFGQNVQHKYVRYAAWAAAPLTGLTVISTFSRAGFLALVCSSATFILLQRHRSLLIVISLLLLPVGLLVAPIPEGYFDRIQTIQTYEEQNESSALSRLHFWRVALTMSADNPLGIGPWQFQARYDEYDDLGIYGRRRAVHNSFLQALTETGWLGGAVYVGLFIASAQILLRVRRQANDVRLPPAWRHFQWTAANALLASVVAFVVGGNFISMAYNDLTWVTFGLVAVLDRLARQERARVAALPAAVEFVHATP